MAMTVPEDGLPQEISNHPDCQEHNNKLNRVTDTKNFSCHGCLEDGSGARYRFKLGGKHNDYHICCAIAPSMHPTSGDLKFCSMPPIRYDGKGKFCEACGNAVNRFVYHRSNNSGDDVRYYHPCCALQSCNCVVPAKKKERKMPMRKHGNPFDMAG